VSRFAAVVLTLWAGSLWTVCGIAAPVAFAVLEDRHAAGRVTAMLFEIETWLGAACALLLFAAALVHKPLAVRLAPSWLIAATAAAPLLSELVLSPMMAAARAANDMGRFGLLHGVAAVLFVAAALGALVLVLRFNRPAR
jgi:4-hydroxybenzoate polyprenyltransferase